MASWLLQRYALAMASGEFSPERILMSGHAIHIKVDGRTYSGTYNVDRKILTVTTTYGKKSAEIALKMAHETLAHQLLQELVQQEKSRKGSTL
jgi:roadblock/LC7 domain-containing protein